MSDGVDINWLDDWIFYDSRHTVSRSAWHGVLVIDPTFHNWSSTSGPRRS